MQRKSVCRMITSLGAVVLLTAVTVHAQTTSPQSAPSDLLSRYQAAAGNWGRIGYQYAVTLFGLLAAIEVAWMASILALEKDSLESWLAPVLKKIMTIGFFWMLLSGYHLWLPAIINSFTQIGQNAGGISGNLNPSDIMLLGLKISGNMLASAIPSGGVAVGGVVASLIPGVGQALTAAALVPALIVLLGALMVFISYVVITIAFIMANVESYIALGAGVIFLGFGASRWTVPYVERYLSLVVSTGVRLMVLYMIIGLGQTLGAQWATDASSLPLTPAGCQSILGIAAGTLTFMAVAWSVPKMVASVLGGSLSAGAGDMLGPATAIGVGAMTAGAAVASGGAAVAAMSASAAASAGTLSAGSAAGASSVANGVMATDAAASPAVDPLVAGSSSMMDTNGSVVASPPGSGTDAAGGSAGTASSAPQANESSAGKSTNAEPPQGVKATGGAGEGKASIAEQLRMVRDEAQTLAQHAPQDSTPASAAQLNIQHGE